MDDNLVYFDQLTHCHSRYYYDNVCKPKYKDKDCCIIFCDINGLKKINDTKGHHYGTKLIKQVSNELLHINSVTDVCRFGGDEFVMFSDIDFDERTLQKIGNISYGVYKKYSCEDLCIACQKADILMYQMKKKI